MAPWHKHSLAHGDPRRNGLFHRSGRLRAARVFVRGRLHSSDSRDIGRHRVRARICQAPLALDGYIATPISAIVGAWLEGHPLTLWGFGNIGPLLPQVHDVGLSVAALHTTLRNIILWVAGVHSVAALFHHFLLRDSVLLSMLPGHWRWPPVVRKNSIGDG
jgi:hypothetical protein